MPKYPRASKAGTIARTGNNLYLSFDHGGEVMVRRLTRSITVKAPSTFALAFANTYFLERAQVGGAELALRFPLPRFLIEGLTVEKRVMLQLKYSPGGRSGHALAIGWQPLGVGPLPSFEGTLTAIAQTQTTSELCIAGSYTPPGGIAGVVFDQVIGARIAGATVAALLEQFRRAIEADFALRSAL